MESYESILNKQSLFEIILNSKTIIIKFNLSL